MGYKATRNTYAIDASSGVEVRRLVSAGDVFPAGYEPETSSDVEQTDEVATVDNIVGGSASVDPNAGSVDANSTGDPVDDLKGEDLDARAADLEIEGRSSMTADEKRDAIRKAEGASQ